jgi:hypothetical protein
MRDKFYDRTAAANEDTLICGRVWLRMLAADSYVGFRTLCANAHFVPGHGSLGARYSNVRSTHSIATRGNWTAAAAHEASFTPAEPVGDYTLPSACPFSVLAQSVAS